MKKRVISTCLVLVLILSGVLTGCGKENKEKTAEDGVVYLEFWGQIPAENGPDAAVEAFNKSHDDIQVEYVHCTNDDSGTTKIDMSLMSGGDADIFFSMDTVGLSRRIEAGNAEPLSELMKKKGFNIEEAYGEDLADYKFNGEYYTLPTTLSNQVILYNQTMFDELGIPHPTAGWSYDEFLIACEKLQESGVYGYFFPPYDAGQPATEIIGGKLGENWVYTEDGESVNIDIPEMKDALERYMDRVERGIEVDFVDNKTQKMNPQDMLLQEKSGMVFGNWLLRYVNDTETYPHDFVTGFATMPKMDENQEHLYTSNFGDYLSINSKSENKEEAFEFIRWFLEGGMAPVVKNGRIPAYAGYNMDEVVEAIFSGKDKLYDLEEAKNVFITPQDKSIRTNHRAEVEINTIMTEEFEKVFAGSQSIDEAIEKAQSRAEKQFEAAK